MNLSQLTAEFQRLVAPDIPNEWDLEENLGRFLGWDEDQVHQVLHLVPVIWPVSHSLCYSYLAEAGNALRCLRSDQLFEWIGLVLDQYEQGGLRQAQRYMSDVAAHHLCRLRGEGGLELGKTVSRLLPYARGLARGHIDLAAGPAVFTDLDTIWLPAKVETMRCEEDNFLLYRLMIAYQWGFAVLGSFDVLPDGFLDGPRQDRSRALERYFAGFSSPRLALDLYQLLEAVRVTGMLERELPGLMRDSSDLRASLFGEGNAGDLRRNLCRAVCQGVTDGHLEAEEPLGRFFRLAGLGQASAQDSLAVLTDLYPQAAEAVDGESLAPLFIGEFRLDAVASARLRRREEQKNRFIELLGRSLLALEPGQRDSLRDKLESSAPGAPAEKDGLTMLPPPQQEPGWEATGATLLATIDNSGLEDSEEIRQLADRIIADVGQLPAQYLASAFGQAGRAASDQTPSSGGMEEEGMVLGAPVCYDEWDFRRSGFRKQWCVLTEKELGSVRSSFLQQTLHNHRGQILKLRRQFEMLRTRERFVRRQREGDDIDLDALTESLADSAAGLPPSDRLFIRLVRDERDIAALFLVDMSNSTAGWVSTTIKEALILLSEAMETVGDRYAIYGFSGMRRLRCEIFPIKSFTEVYGEAVQERICSIAPREYTRMGPAIRHSTTILKGIEARVRLLVILSDGKPEDYDDYKGEYAIEDTRHALIESRAAGMYPFCITIDQHDHEYLAHMYGKNYIFLNDIRRLPARMPEIYRVLTS